MLYTLNEDKDLVSGPAADPLVIRSNVGDCVAITFGNDIDNARAATRTRSWQDEHAQSLRAVRPAGK